MQPDICKERGRHDSKTNVPVSEISVKPLQVCQYITLLKWDETSIFSVEIIEKFWGNMETLSSQTAVENRNVNQRRIRDLPWMSFSRAFRLASLLQVGVFLLAVLTSAFMFSAWSWPGSDGLSASRLGDRFSVLCSITCVIKPQTSRPVCNRGSTAEFLTGCVQVFGEHMVMLRAGTLVSVATFWEKLEARNVSDSLPDWQRFCRRFCLLRAPSTPLASRDDTAALLFFCGCVFVLRQELWLNLHACFFVLNIAKRHFSLHFLHIQSCSLQYKRLLARLDRWETPLTEDMDPFFLWGYFALRQLLCLRCICEKLLQKVWWRVTWGQEVVDIFQLIEGQVDFQRFKGTNTDSGPVLCLDMHSLGHGPLSLNTVSDLSWHFRSATLSSASVLFKREAEF